MLNTRKSNIINNKGSLHGGVRELLVIALPMVISQLCETLMMFTDRFFLARLGPEQMSAAMGGGITCFLFMTFFIGLAGFTGPLVAQHLGAGQRDRCAVAVTQAMIISVVACPVIIFCLPIGHWMFKFSSIDSTQRVYQEQYFNIMIYGAILGLLRNNLSCFFSGIGRTSIVMVSAAVSLIVNVIANYILIFGHFGSPALGVRGAAIGTVIGAFCGLMVLVLRYFSPIYCEEYLVHKSLHFDRQLMIKLFKFGSPSGFEFFMNILAFNVLVHSFHSYGRNSAAAMTIMLNWEMISFIPLIGVGIGVSSLVGRYMGAKDPDTAHKTVMSGVKVACLYTSVTFILFCIFPSSMVSVFQPQGVNITGFREIAELATFMLRMVVIYLFADAMLIVFSGALRGAGDTFSTMLISVIGHWVYALGAIIMVRFLDYSPQMTWTITVLLSLLLGISMFLRYYSGKWRTLTVVKELPLPMHEEQDLLF